MGGGGTLEAMICSLCSVSTECLQDQYSLYSVCTVSVRSPYLFDARLSQGWDDTDVTELVKVFLE